MNEIAGDTPLTTPTDPSVVLALQNVYLKDCSYESPNGPRMEGNWNPQINLDLQTSSTVLGPEVRACGRLATREPGRLPAIPAPAREFRRAVRRQPGAAARHQLTQER